MSLSRNGPGWDAGHFYLIPGLSLIAGHPSPKGNELGTQMGPMSKTKLSPNWYCQMGPIHFPTFLLSELYQSYQKILFIQYMYRMSFKSCTRVLKKACYCEFF